MCLLHRHNNMGTDETSGHLALARTMGERRHDQALGKGSTEYSHEVQHRTAQGDEKKR